jgi:WD40 repeat protein
MLIGPLECKDQNFPCIHFTHFGSWNPNLPNVKHSTDLKGHAAGIEKVAFNPVKDAELCSISSDGVVKFWDVRTKAVINEVKGLGDTFTLAWCPDGETLIVGNKVNCHIPHVLVQIFITTLSGRQSFRLITNTNTSNILPSTIRSDKPNSILL